MDPKIMDEKIYTAFTWLRTGTSGGRWTLVNTTMNFQFHRVQGIS
jgi:hypothetical protein